jgi:DNA-3-methyladenine glycosylase I
MSSYCEYIRSHPEDALNKNYHDHEYGFPLEDDNLLFERFVLEINQAGLSWITILRKAGNFRLAYDGFDIDKVASYGEGERERLLNDAGIIRNRLKINAAIENAKRIQALRAEHGSFKGWLEAQSPLLLLQWSRLFKTTFVFTGEEIVREFLISTGYLPGAHDKKCSTYKIVKARKPPWTWKKG